MSGEKCPDDTHHTHTQQTNIMFNDTQTT